MSIDDWQNDECVIFPKEISGLSCLNYENSMVLFSFVNSTTQTRYPCITDSKADCNATPTLSYTFSHTSSSTRQILSCLQGERVFTVSWNRLLIVSVVFYLTARLFLLKRRRGGAIRWFGSRGSHSEEEIDPLCRSEFAGFGSWWWKRSYDWNKHGGRWSLHLFLFQAHRKRNRWRDTWDREING